MPLPRYSLNSDLAIFPEDIISPRLYRLRDTIRRAARRRSADRRKKEDHNLKKTGKGFC